MGNTQLKVHLARLVELEYVLVHRGRQGQGYVYELAYDGQGEDGTPFLPGLAAACAGTPTDSATAATSHVSEANFAPAGRPADGPQTPGGRTAENAPNSRESAGNLADAATTPASSRPGANDAATSYVPPSQAAG
jgi:hypothetical protein